MEKINNNYNYNKMKTGALTLFALGLLSHQEFTQAIKLYIAPEDITLQMVGL